MNLVIEVIEIKGKCPVYKLGDKIIIEEGFKLATHKSVEKICMHSLSSLMPYYVALSKGVSPAELGLSKKEKKDKNEAYLQCLDPCEYTGGGTCIFKIEIL